MDVSEVKVLTVRGDPHAVDGGNLVTLIIGSFNSRVSLEALELYPP